MHISILDFRGYRWEPNSILNFKGFSTWGNSPALYHPQQISVTPGPILLLFYDMTIINYGYGIIQEFKTSLT